MRSVVIGIICVVWCTAQENFITTVNISELQPTHTRIVGGHPANIERYPFAAQVQYLSRTVCGGSLITPQHVLTAAHCFYDDRGNLVSFRRYTVRVGTSYLQSGGAVHSISTVIPHEQYNTPLRDNDVAVMVLTTRVTYTTRVTTARIPEAGTEFPDNTIVWHIGWGTMAAGSGTMSPVLREVEVRTVSHAECLARYHFLETLQSVPYPLTTSMLCSGILDVGGKDACQGDSGGPLVYGGDVVAGVTSWGYGCAEPLFPGVNAKVSSYTNWINDTVMRHNTYQSVQTNVTYITPVDAGNRSNTLYINSVLLACILLYSLVI